MNVITLREATRRKIGLPSRGAKGKARFLDVVNIALRRVFRDSPDNFFRDWWRFRLDTVYSTGTMDVNTNDPLVFVLESESSGTLPVDGTLRARWLELTDSSGDFHYRRIRDVWVGSSPKTATNKDFVSVDKPWANVTDTTMAYRIYTAEYPYPRDVTKVFKVIRNPEQTPHQMLEALHSEEMDAWRLGYGWRDSGIIAKYGQGNHYKMVAPHDTPAVALDTSIGPEKWGFDAGNVNEHRDTYVGERYEAGGTFSYRYCYVWGRRRNPALIRSGDREPFYISAPSEESSQITSTWGGGAVEIDSQHGEYTLGYGINSTLPSFNRGGLEKWWFRARHANEAASSGTNLAYSKRPETDGVYYLWRITDADVEQTIDRGDNPPEKEFPLKEWSGDYHHVLYDKIATSNESMMARVKRMPELVRTDADALHVPDECANALVAMVCAILCGDRTGDLSKKATYEDKYSSEIEQLRRNYLFMNSEHRPFGDGLGPAIRHGISDYPITDIT